MFVLGERRKALAAAFLLIIFTTAAAAKSSSPGTGAEALKFSEIAALSMGDGGDEYIFFVPEEKDEEENGAWVYDTVKRRIVVSPTLSTTASGPGTSLSPGIIVMPG